MLSEVGTENELSGLLKYVDKNLNPSSQNGGLYYPRDDRLQDKEGNWAHIDPFLGNAAIGYARLNIKDGQQGIWEKP